MKDLSNENVIHIIKDGVQYLQFRKLLEYDNIITHAYSLGTDLNFRTAKINKEALPENEYNKAIDSYKKICNSLGTDYKNIVKTNQEHTKTIKIVKEKINKEFMDINLEEYKETDGMITNKRNLMLSTTNADCILFLFFDPDTKTIANVHSGWKGTLQRISAKTVERMQKEFNCKPENIICCICPSIRKCHFKVHADVQEPYYNEFKNLKEIDNLIVPVPGEDRWAIDTVEINKIILKDAGLRDENIVDCGICSVCNSDLIHSFRVEKENYGLGTAIIELK